MTQLMVGLIVFNECILKEVCSCNNKIYDKIVIFKKNCCQVNRTNTVISFFKHKSIQLFKYLASAKLDDCLTLESSKLYFI